MTLPGQPLNSKPLILIVGSADPNRKDYDPPLTNADKAPKAGEDLGAELARRGCRIVVYSAREKYLECDVVRGFVGASKKGARSMIQVRYPVSAQQSAEFPESHSHGDMFDPLADRNSGWEAAFYASLRDADGVLLVGGGRSAQAIGHMALAFEIPVAAVACFGGAAQNVWLAIDPGVDLASNADRQAMNPPVWKSDSARGVVDALLAQAETGRVREAAEQARSLGLAEATEARSRRRRAAISTTAAVVALAVAIVMTAWGIAAPDAHSAPSFVWLLFLVGPVAGTAGALASTAWRGEDDGRMTITTAGLGFVAGAVSSLLYLLAQFSTANDAQAIKSVAVLVAMATGLLSGFTFDQVFKQAIAGKLRPQGGVSSPLRLPPSR